MGKDEILNYFYTNSADLGINSMIIIMFGGLVIGAFIYLTYFITYRGVAYNAKFNASLIIILLICVVIMLMISSNIVISLGLVGALSIVRFRTAIKDSRDTAYIFWTIIVGICCGVGDYLVAGVGTAMVFVVLLALGRVRNENRILLIIRGAKDRGSDMERIVFSYFNQRALLRVRNTTPDHVELIYEMPRKVWQMNYQKDVDISDALYALGGTEYVNTVTQSDEISG